MSEDLNTNTWMVSGKVSGRLVAWSVGVMAPARGKRKDDYVQWIENTVDGTNPKMSFLVKRPYNPLLGIVPSTLNPLYLCFFSNHILPSCV